MKSKTQFQIKTVDELKEAYELFKDRWGEQYTLEYDINDFNHNKDFRYITCKYDSSIFLSQRIYSYEKVKNPLKEI